MLDEAPSYPASRVRDLSQYVLQVGHEAIVIESVKRAGLQSDTFDVQQSCIDSSEDVLESLSNLIYTCHIHLEGREEETEKHATAENGGISREQRLEALEKVIQVAFRPSCSIDTFDHLAQLVHLELDVL